MAALATAIRRFGSAETAATTLEYGVMAFILVVAITVAVAVITNT